MGHSDVWREEEHLIPRSCGGKLVSLLLSVVPTIGVIALAVVWFRTNKQIWEMSETRATLIRHQSLQIAQLIIDFNVEREMTAYFVTARSDYTQAEAKDALDAARDRSDRSLSQLLLWPGTTGGPSSEPQTPSDDKMYRSKPLFSAFLGHHRLDVKHGGYFWDEIQYYTDIIDVLLGWFNRASDSLTDTGGPQTLNRPPRRVWRLLNAYGYLLGAISYLGAEQALCTVFHAIVCFSHRETFYYSNFSFAGEALYRLYRQSYPSMGEEEEGEDLGGRGIDWRTAPQKSLFPELYACRMEILADLDYIGMTSDPSSCSYGRKNETRFYETDTLTVGEAGALSDAVLSLLDQDTADRLFDLWTSAAVLTGTLAYVIVTHVVRCACVLCANARLRRMRKEKLSKFQTASSQLNSQDGVVGVAKATGDCYATCRKPPVDDASGNHSRQVTTVASATMDNGCNDSRQRRLSSSDNCCYNHSASPSLLALKVASV